MAGKKIEALPLPAPVLHDLRRQLDKIPRDIGPIEGLDLNLAQEVMDQVTELMKDGLDLTMSQECRVTAARRSHVSTHQAQMRHPDSRRIGAAGDQ